MISRALRDTPRLSRSFAAEGLVQRDVRKHVGWQHNCGLVGMDTVPTVLCAVDYSAASQTALGHAASAAKYLQGRLVVLTVVDPLLAEAMAASHHNDWQDTERRDLRAFCAEHLGGEHGIDVEVDVRIGTAAEEILAAAERLDATLIVMGCHGLTGVRKVFFGSTTERLLRDTAFPVLVVPANAQARPTPNPATLIRHIVVPIDLTDSAESLTAIGARLGSTLGVPVILVHVIEPVTLRARWRGQLPSMQSEARHRAEAAVDRLVEGADGMVEPLIIFGEPAEEVGKVAAVRAAGLVVMGLQHRGSGRVGVIAYRILTSTHVPVLAVPAVFLERFQGDDATPSAGRVGHLC